MCGTLKFENMTARIGNLIPYSTVYCDGKGTWSGFIQEEKASWWAGYVVAQAKIFASAFTEKPRNDISVIFELPQGTNLIAAVLRQNVIVRGRVIGARGDVKIVTRAPGSEFEKKIHKRWPLVMHQGRRLVFEEKDKQYLSSWNKNEQNKEILNASQL